LADGRGRAMPQPGIGGAHGFIEATWVNSRGQEMGSPMARPTAKVTAIAKPPSNS
jgi:hypothetical protein